MFALVDVNNYYASCERVFNPALQGKPIVVLSNNDGCCVSRSDEVKALGVKMGTPWYQIRDLAKQHGIQAFSSNYALYADMSNRTMSILAQFSPRVEVYSIDEAFVDVGNMPHVDLTAYSQRIRARVLQWLGLPVCVGIASSKTLAKLANHVAKKRSAYVGVCDWSALTTHVQDDLLASIEVGEVWGVGRRIAARLAEMDIHTVGQLRAADTQTIRRRFSVVLERTVWELRGIPCLALEEVAPAKQQIMCSRSFSHAVTGLPELSQAVVTYVTRAAEKLRHQGSLAGMVQVFIQTNEHKPAEPQYYPSHTLSLPDATDDTRTLVRYALHALRGIYRPGYRYIKAGVMLSALSTKAHRQGNLLSSEAATQKAAALMAVMDTINRREGRNTVFLAGTGINPSWHMRRERQSPHYTTRWTEVPTVTCK